MPGCWQCAAGDEKRRDCVDDEVRWQRPLTAPRSVYTVGTRDGLGHVACYEHAAVAQE